MYELKRNFAHILRTPPNFFRNGISTSEHKPTGHWTVGPIVFFTAYWKMNIMKKETISNAY